MIEDLQKQLDKLMDEQNSRGRSEFDGYSPTDMQHLVYDTFGEYSPILLQKLSDSVYQEIPLLSQIKYLAALISVAGDLKLTQKGFLPVKIVSRLYSQGFIKDENIDPGIYRLYKETDSLSINLTRILMGLSGLTKKRNNRLSLTRKGEKILDDNFELLPLIVQTFCSRFNWAYYDGFGENKIGQLGYGFSLILLSKYGDEQRLDTYYSTKYFKAFPQLVSGVADPVFGSLEDQSARCYSVRTFDRFLDLFGLIKIDSDKRWDADKYITKTKLFDKLIGRTPPNN